MPIISLDEYIERLEDEIDNHDRVMNAKSWINDGEYIATIFRDGEKMGLLEAKTIAEHLLDGR